MKSIILLGDESARYQFIRELHDHAFVLGGHEINCKQFKAKVSPTTNDFNDIDFVIYVGSDKVMDKKTREIIAIVPDDISLEFYHPECDGSVHDFFKAIFSDENKMTYANDATTSFSKKESTNCFCRSIFGLFHTPSNSLSDTQQSLNQSLLGVSRSG